MEKKLNFIYPILFLIFGLFIFFYPMFFDFSKMAGDLGDARLVSYLLDHGFLYLTGDNFHSSYFNIPFFYPYQNQLFYTDILFGGTILYVPIRLFVKNPFSAVQIWLILVSVLNFLSFYLVSKKVFKFSTLISSTTAFLFAFSLPRFNQIEHYQLFLQFYSIFAFYFFITANKKTYKFILSAIFLVLQVVTTFYFGYLTLFSLFLLLFILMLRKTTRNKTLNYLKENIKGIFFFVLILTVCLVPVACYYLSVSKGFKYTSLYLFSPLSLFLSHSFLDNKIAPFNLQDFNQEQITGFGIFTTTMVLGGLFSLKKYKFEISVFILSLIIMFLFWQVNILLYFYIPGVSAIRAGARAIFILLPVFCFLVGKCLSHLDKKHFIIFLLIILLEQIPVNNAFKWTKEEHIKRIERYEINSNCPSFGIFETSIAGQIDAMWLSNKYKIPTINGYSGFMPPVYIFQTPPRCLFEANK